MAGKKISTGVVGLLLAIFGGAGRIWLMSMASSTWDSAGDMRLTVGVVSATLVLVGGVVSLLAIVKEKETSRWLGIMGAIIAAVFIAWQLLR